MSPEQASLNNLDVDTRTDMYALGVLLYELLAGSPPFAPKDLERRGLLEVLRVVREEEPPRPSTRLSTAAALPALSASRGTEPKKLTGLLRNELDWIVMKALEKDRSRRYETATGLAADVTRYLGGDAVQAHPPTAAYRARKFVRRNRGRVVAAGLVLVALVAGMAGTTAGLIAARHQERVAVAARHAEADRAEGERAARVDAQASEKLAGERLVQVEAERAKADAARVEAQASEAEANAVATFFQDRVFAAARPRGRDGGLGAGVALRDAIAASVPALAAGFAGQPVVEARLRRALGITFSHLAEHEQARDQFERARALDTRHRGPDHPSTLGSMHNLANSYAALNRPAAALTLREETLAIRKRVLPPDHPDTFSSMAQVANSYSELSRYADALKLYAEALAARKRVLPKDHPGTPLNMAQVVETLVQLDRGAEALPLLDEIIAKVPDRPGVNAHLIPHAFGLRGMHFRTAGDLAGCRATAETWEELNRADADSLYDAACFRAVTSAMQAKTPGADAARLAKEDADRAMDWLRKAVQAGYKDAAHMKTDTYLDPLRPREDFKKLIAELEKPPETAPPPREKK